MRFSLKSKFLFTSCIVIISVLSCIVSFFSLWIALPIMQKNGIPPFDYIGVTVAILALLVTLLIGWNIWSTIDVKNSVDARIDIFKSELKEQEGSVLKTVDVVGKLADQVNKDRYINQAIQAMGMALFSQSVNYYSQCYLSTIKALWNWTQIEGQDDYVKSMIDECVNKLSFYYSLAEQKGLDLKTKDEIDTLSRDIIMSKSENFDETQRKQFVSVELLREKT